MTKTNVLDEKYEKLQNEIQSLHEKWRGEISEISLNGLEQVKEGSPIIPQLDLSININQYQQFIEELLQLIGENNSDVTNAAEKLKELLTAEMLQTWFKEAITVNHFYFANLAEEHELPEWLPIFLAEQAVRPFLQAATVELEPTLKEMKHTHCCSSCGEPARFAILNKKGKKEQSCPRCHYAWEEKKISCAHCGSEDELVILKVEGDESAEIHACHKCKGYTKVIDTRKMFKKESPTLLDVKSIHLDFIAQEKGFGISEDENQKAH
ncbi:FdhE protein [Cytobacillus eiseniae]|uniref:FdhE protein n=1 Tax=Cytobacillus eiseniae TaxID=762947 RepID=A0ABS4RLN7_9BACI|nr:formate dehydrogenase accessory protein FdhE [Cytobacillus eiseniae]MBP2243209.1 FdhE protein [Cytobacillus eiseniae]